MPREKATHDQRLKHFRRLVKAYRVRSQNGEWIVKRLGGRSRTFTDKDQAIEAAKKKASHDGVGVLVFEGGHVSELR
jgi:hypothetical protein